MQELNHAYESAQHAISELKASIRTVLSVSPHPLSNAEIGRTLGVYMGHIGHEGHISRTLLAMMQAEGVVDQDEKNKRWHLVDHIDVNT
ncbi:hypothetical protein [Halocynthiibacter namhaensis]|uniref:hypothetical protein n=1 Tax=Halocynthiibacter namhaensis TaxID=1290553 RepID=UPI000579033B|nr:hypothetical protein [Halocynthiibacter namhaensis]